MVKKFGPKTEAQTRRLAARARARTTVRRAVRAKPRPQLDASSAHAAAYVALLRDPCGSRMVRPTFEGAGGSYMVRTRTMTTTVSTAADVVYQFSPCFGFNCIQTTAALTASGNPLGVTANNASPAFLSSGVVGSFRCVAACVRVHYTGTELNRSGLVGSSLVNGPQLGVGVTPTLAIGAYIAGSQRVVRLGEEIHEVRWVPSAGDSNFFANNDPPGTFTGDSTGNAVIVAVQDAPLGKLSFELNAVWEWVPNMNVGNGLPNNVAAPVSGATLNSTLSRIKDLVAFATHPDTMGAASNAMQGMARMGFGRSAARMIEL